MSEITSSKSSKSIFPWPASVSITGISCHITTSYHHCLCRCHLQIPKSSTNVLDFGVQTRTQKHKLEEWGPTMARVDGLSCPSPKPVFPFNTYILQLTTLATPLVFVGTPKVLDLWNRAAGCLFWQIRASNVTMPQVHGSRGTRMRIGGDEPWAIPQECMFFILNPILHIID